MVNGFSFLGLGGRELMCLGPMLQSLRDGLRFMRLRV
jgi:hypothetical protein